MSHHGRHDHPNSIHLVSVRGRLGGDIFWRAAAAHYPPELEVWESLLARMCDRHDTRIVAYAWLPNEALFLLERSAVSMAVVLASVLGQYSRYLHKRGRAPPGRSPYVSRYESIEITPSSLPYAVRHVYWRAVRAGVCRRPEGFPWCSYALHFGGVPPPWFDPAPLGACLAAQGVCGRLEIERFLSEAESARHAGLFLARCGRTPRIAGNRADIERVQRQALRPPPPPTLHHIVEQVRRLLRRPFAAAARDVLGKSLIAWYATRSGAGTLAQMAARFGCSPSTLRRAIESHRRASPELFECGIEAQLCDGTRP